MSENQNDFSGFTVSAHCKPEYNFGHNNRVPGVIFNEEHIGEGEHENWIGGDEIEPKKLFNTVFKEAIDDYNKNQKRKDRKKTDYFQEVLDDGRFGKKKTLKLGNREKIIDISRKPIYEFILQFGNRDEHPDSEIVKPILKEFIEKEWNKKFGKNFIIVRADYHDDEYSEDENGDYTVKSPAHVHVDFVPVVEKSPEELKGRGVLKMKLQHSLSGACEQIGYFTTHLSKKDQEIKQSIKKQIKLSKEKGNKELVKNLKATLEDYTTYTNQQLFEEDVRHTLADFAKEKGLLIDLTPREKHSHKSKDFFKQKKEVERLEKKQKEISDEIETSVKENEEKTKALAEREITLLEKEESLSKTQTEIEAQKQELETSQKEADAIIENLTKIKDKNIEKQNEIEKIIEAGNIEETDLPDFPTAERINTKDFEYDSEKETESISKGFLDSKEKIAKQAYEKGRKDGFGAGIKKATSALANWFKEKIIQQFKKLQDKIAAQNIKIKELEKENKDLLEITNSENLEKLHTAYINIGVKNYNEFKSFYQGKTLADKFKSKLAAKKTWDALEPDAQNNIKFYVSKVAPQKNVIEYLMELENKKPKAPEKKKNRDWEIER